MHPRIEFRHNPLKVVVVQFKFAALYGLTEPASLAAFQRVLGERFPKAPPRMQQVTVEIKNEGGLASNVSLGPVRLSSDDGTWLVNIAPDSISLETTAYESWADFRARLEVVAGAMPLRPAVATRIGVRYVDHIQAPGIGASLEWQPYIAPALLGARDGLVFDERLVQGLQQLSFAIGEDIVNVRHGYVKNEAAAEFPSTYLIDTDLFTEVEQPFEMPAILARIERYHDWAWSLFRRSITPAAVTLLGGVES